MKITKLLLLSLAVIFLSCKDDDDPQPSNSGLAGSWKISDLEYGGTTTTSSAAGTVSAIFTGVAKEMDLIVSFTENPNTVVSEGSYVIELTTTTMGQTTTMDYPFEKVFRNGTWGLDGNTLIVSDNLATDEVIILEQTETTLKLKFDVSQTVTNQGTTVTTDVEGTYTFTKI